MLNNFPREKYVVTTQNNDVKQLRNWRWGRSGQWKFEKSSHFF